MDSTVALILGFTAYKISCVGAGAFVCWLGYKLFVSGLVAPAGDMQAKYLKASLVIKSAAPGTFFAILGMLLATTAVYRGYDLKIPSGVAASEGQPKIAKPALP